MYYRADDTVASEWYEAPDMDTAIRMARESWGSAEPKGAYDVEIREYSDDAMEDPTGYVCHITCIAK